MKYTGIVIFLFIGALVAKAQSLRVAYPELLKNSYVNINMGDIYSPFNNTHLHSDYIAEQITTRGLAIKINIGHQITKKISAEINYLRPILWSYYSGINGDKHDYSIFTNIGALSLKYKQPIYKNWSVYGSMGFSIMTRRSVERHLKPLMKEVNYASVLFGSGIQYQVNDKWDLIAGYTFAQKSKKHVNPHTRFWSIGFSYYMRPMKKEKIEHLKKVSKSYKEHTFQLGITTNSLGYGVNNFLTERKVPVFWGGAVEIKQGITLNYLHNSFHTKKVFSLDWGASIGLWQSEKHNNTIASLSIFPMLRFMIARTKYADFFALYSLAGPTLLNKSNIDHENTGKLFTFRDFMGLGAYFGKERAYNAELQIGHFSNGNLFPYNPGLKIPLTFTLGYCFN